MPSNEEEVNGENSDSTSSSSDGSDSHAAADVEDPQGVGDYHPLVVINRGVSFLQEVAYPNQQELKNLVRKTDLHVELSDDLMQATFELMKQVVLEPNSCSAVCDKQPDVQDFRRAYGLVNDWLPTHPNDPDKSSLWMWYTSKRAMLKALLKLAEEKVLPGQDTGEDFAQWIDGEIEAMQKDPKVQEILSRKTMYQHQNFSSREFVCSQKVTARWNCCSSEVSLRDVVHHNLLAMHAILCESSTRLHLYWWQKVFRMLHIVYIILMVNTFALFEAGSMGFITQFFLDLNITHVGDFVVKEWLMVVLSPFLLLIGALAGTELFELAADSMSNPPFVACRSYMMVTWEILFRRQDALMAGLNVQTLHWLDMFFTLGLIIPCTIGGLTFGGSLGLQNLLQALGDKREEAEMEHIQSRGFMNGQMHGVTFTGLCWCIVVCILYTFCKLVTGIYATTRLALGTDQNTFPVLAVVRVIQDNLLCYNVFPGFCWRYAVTINRRMSAYTDDHLSWAILKVQRWVDDEKSPHRPWPGYAEKIAAINPRLHSARMRNVCLYASAAFVAWPLVYLLIRVVVSKLIATQVERHTLHVISIWTCGLLIMLALWCLVEAICRLMPKLDSSALRSHIWFFQGLNLVMMLLSTWHNQWLFEGTIDPVMFKNSTDLARNYYNSVDTEGEDSKITPYPVCQMRWGQESLRSFHTGRLTAIDLGVLSWYSYAANRSMFEDLVNHSFGRDVQVLNVSKFDMIPRTAMVRFPATTPPGAPPAGTIVVAVKGTSTMEEAFADMGMYTNMAMLQLLDKVLPILHTFPVSVISMAIGHLTVPFSGKVVKGFLDDLRQSVNDARAQHPHHSIVLTGHSLGGGLAEVAAGQLGIPALVFSAPGNLFVTKELHIQKKQVYRNIVGIVPDDDVVPRIDEHADMVQHIQCLDARGVPRDSMTCHSALVTICELWRVCGDVQRRDFVHTCVEKKGYVKETCQREENCY